MSQPLSTEMRSNLHIAKWVLGRDKSRVLIFACCIQIFLSSLEIAFLVLISPLISALGGNNSAGHLAPIFGLFSFSLREIFLIITGIVLVKNLGSVALQRWLLYSFAERESEVTTAIIQKTMIENIDQSNLTQSSDLVQVFFGVIYSIFSSLFRPLIGFAGDLLTVFALIAGLLIINPTVALIAILYFGVIGSVVGLCFSRAQKRQGKAALDLGRQNIKTYSEMQKIRKELLLAGKEDEMLQSFHDQKRRQSRLLASSNILSFMPRYILELCLVLGLTGLVIFLQTFSHEGDLLSVLAVVVAAGFRLLPSLNNILIAIGNFRFSIAPLKRIEELRSQLNLGTTPLSLHFPSRKGVARNFEGDLVMRGVTYRYPGATTDVFTNLDFILKKNSTLLITGPSGTGKTTLIGLATGLISPTSGVVSVNTGMQEFSMSEKIVGIQYLTQEVAFINASVAYNVALRATTRSDIEDLRRAAGAAGILDRIDADPLGFDAFIGENGNQLSAGERQRLGLARSLFSNPKLLVLDEPTANLDSESEKIIWKSLVGLKGSLSILIISHREVPRGVFDEEIDLSEAGSAR